MVLKAAGHAGLVWVNLATFTVETECLAASARHPGGCHRADRLFPGGGLMLPGLCPNKPPTARSAARLALRPRHFEQF